VFNVIKKPMKNVCFATTYILVIFASFHACKKTNHALISGRWKKVFYAIDTNGNGSLDSNEKIYPNAYASNELVIFSDNGKGQVIYKDSVIEVFLWKLKNNNTYLEVTDTGYSKHIVSYQHVDVLTSTTMILSDTSSMSKVWDVFVKQ
jgi:hypothetical protein